MAAVSELTAVERAALVGYMLASGASLDSAQVATLAGYETQWAARRLLNKLCRVLPLAEDNGQFVVIKGR